MQQLYINYSRTGNVMKVSDVRPKACFAASASLASVLDSGIYERIDFPLDVLVNEKNPLMVRKRFPFTDLGETLIGILFIKKAIPEIHPMSEGQVSTLSFSFGEKIQSADTYLNRLVSAVDNCFRAYFLYQLMMPRINKEKVLDNLIADNYWTDGLNCIGYCKDSNRQPVDLISLIAFDVSVAETVRCTISTSVLVGLIRASMTADEAGKLKPLLDKLSARFVRKGLFGLRLLK